MSKKSELILHPVRLRLVAELGNRRLTTRQLAAALPDVPQATLYRHIKRLRQGGIIEVAGEENVNGALERTYAVLEDQSRFTREEMLSISAEQHSQYFSVFVAGLIDTFRRYIDRTQPGDYAADGLSYNQAVMYLSSEERMSFQKELLRVVNRALAQQPAPNRKRYTLASVVIPDERSEQ